MQESNARVLAFPTPVSQRVDHAAKAAVRILARAELISESEAVRALDDLGANQDEIDLLRALYALKRGRI